MIKLSKLDVILVDIPTIRPCVLAMTTIHAQSSVIIRLTSDDGLEGLGEVSTIGGLSYGPESPEGIALTIETYLKPILQRADLSRVGEVVASMDAHVCGNTFAKSAVEMALMDAAGKRSGLTLSALIAGGPRRRNMPVAWTLASGNTDQDIAEAKQMIADKRHDIFKLKIGKRTVSEDINHAAKIKEALGDEASIRVDVNQNWSEVQAHRAIGYLSDAGIELIEQPVDRDNLAALSALTSSHRAVIMADEALSGSVSAFNVAKTCAADVFSIKIATSGGIMKAYEVAAIGHAAGIGLYGGTMLEGGIATAAAAHLCSCLPALEWGTELFGPILLADSILDTQIEYNDFCVSAPTGPGLGVTINEDKLNEYRRDRVSTSAYSMVGTA